MTQARSDDTRRRILQSAEACFAESGYEAAGVAEICQRAAVSKGAFYHHFPSKQAVFQELFDLWLAALDADVATAAESGRTVPESLSDMADVLTRVFQEGSGRLPIFLEFWSQAARDPAMWQATIEPYRRYAAFFEGLMARAMAEGSLPEGDCEVPARALVSLAIGLVLQGLLDPEGADWARMATGGVRLLLAGLGAGNEPPVPESEGD